MSELCSRGIPWAAHKLNAVGNWAYFIVEGATVCGHDAQVADKVSWEVDK